MYRNPLRPDGLADLAGLGFTPEQHEERRQFIGGSDATIIASKDKEAINLLAQIKRGEAKGENLDNVLQVMLGHWSEPFILAWMEKLTGDKLVNRGVPVANGPFPWMRASLDAWNETKGMPVNAKHTNAFSNAEKVKDSYTAQVTHEMLCSGATSGLLAVLYGNHKFEIVQIDLDPLYAGELVEAEEEFWKAVQEGRDPHPVDIVAPPAPTPLLELDFSDSNSFTDAALKWLEHRDSAASFAEAEKLLKELIPAEAKRIFGHGVEIIKNARGAKSIRAMENV